MFENQKTLSLRAFNEYPISIIVQATYLKAIPKSFEAVGSILAS